MPDFERVFTLQVPSSTENLALIREFVTTIGNQAGLSPAGVAQLELAVDEACANVMEHAYGRDMTKEVSIRAAIDGDTLEIDVIDTGSGIGEQEREAVLRRFYRSDKIRNTPGVGLGLNLVAAIAKLHGFRLVIYPGPGGRMEVVFPDP